MNVEFADHFYEYYYNKSRLGAFGSWSTLTDYHKEGVKQFVQSEVIENIENGGVIGAFIADCLEYYEPGFREVKRWGN